MATWTNRHNILQNTSSCNFYFICYCQKYVPEINMPTKLGIYAKFYHTYSGDVCTCIFHIRHHWHQPFNKVHCIYILHILLNMYGFHIPNTAHTANMLPGHIYPTFLHICQDITKRSFYFMWYCQICVRNKCAHQNGHITYMPNIYHAYTEMYVLVYSTYEGTGTNHLTHCIV